MGLGLHMRPAGPAAHRLGIQGSARPTGRDRRS
nr:MAG TPA: hypothetical protein [Caudoviricetes sp.]